MIRNNKYYIWIFCSVISVIYLISGYQILINSSSALDKWYVVVFVFPILLSSAIGFGEGDTAFLVSLIIIFVVTTLFIYLILKFILLILKDHSNNSKH